MKAVLTDFDGTVTTEDVAELVLQAYTGDAWRAFEERQDRREIGTREAVAGEFALVHAPREDLLAYAMRVATLDATFPAFVAFCRERGIHLEIVSEGLDFYIGPLLERWNLDVPWRASRAVFADRDIRLDYPHRDPTCTLCGTCKMGRVLQLRAAGYEVAYVGDGHSDICPALEADRVFARRALADRCRDEELDFIPFESFADVQRELDLWP